MRLARMFLHEIIRDKTYKLMDEGCHVDSDTKRALRDNLPKITAQKTQLAVEIFWSRKVLERRVLERRVARAIRGIGVGRKPF